MSASLRTFFSPRSVAVIGVGRTEGVGAAIFRNLVAGFTGRVFPVNSAPKPSARTAAMRRQPRFPNRWILAVIAVPALRWNRRWTTASAKACRRSDDHGWIRGRPVTPAGFSKPPCATRLCRGHTHDRPQLSRHGEHRPVRAPQRQLRRRVPAGRPGGVASQSGALGLAMLEAASQLNLASRTLPRLETVPTCQPPTCWSCGTAMSGRG